MSMQPSAPTAAELQKQLDELLGRYKAERAPSEPALRVLHARYLGKEGEIRRRLTEALKAAPGPEKRAIGQIGNAVIAQAEAFFEECLRTLHEAARQARAEAERISDCYARHGLIFQLLLLHQHG